MVIVVGEEVFEAATDIFETECPKPVVGTLIVGNGEEVICGIVEEVVCDIVEVTEPETETETELDPELAIEAEVEGAGT